MKKILLLFSIVFALLINNNATANNHVGKILIKQTVNVVHPSASALVTLQHIQMVKLNKETQIISMQKTGGYQTDILKYPNPVTSISYNKNLLSQKSTKVNNLQYRITVDNSIQLQQNFKMLYKPNKKYTEGSEPILCLQNYSQTLYKTEYSSLSILLKTQGRLFGLCTLS